MSVPSESRAEARSLETVAFMCGAGHSGSTLFGLMLGAHPRVFYAGEAKKSLFLGDESKPRKKRVCKLCGESCPVWSRVPPADPDVHATLARLTGRPVVVDSSKDIAWIERHQSVLSARGVAVRLFFVQRDGRAVVASRLRKYPETSAAEHARAWVTQLEACRALASRFPGGALVVRYESLCLRPAEEIARAAAHLGLEVCPEMTEPWLAEQHPIGGNSGTQWLLTRAPAAGGERPAVLGLGERTRAYYAEHPRAIVLDERWRRELAPATVAEIEGVLGEANRGIGWPG